ncbi:hypothetical protein E2C01_059994 [Portunus trituberculatus]|uniref:Uncharacterized protein n=1 Tax=Portunus trituberculatus TaxID=210409 RepID=A0A5B7H999_PORTR|nr:hypothetical protein [Portunus trituberculatus]
MHFPQHNTSLWNTLYSPQHNTTKHNTTQHNTQTLCITCNTTNRDTIHSLQHNTHWDTLYFPSTQRNTLEHIAFPAVQHIGILSAASDSNGDLLVWESERAGLDLGVVYIVMLPLKLTRTSLCS